MATTQLDTLKNLQAVRRGLVNQLPQEAQQAVAIQLTNDAVISLGNFSLFSAYNLLIGSCMRPKRNADIRGAKQRLRAFLHDQRVVTPGTSEYHLYNALAALENVFGVRERSVSMGLKMVLDHLSKFYALNASHIPATQLVYLTAQTANQIGVLNEALASSGPVVLSVEDIQELVQA